MFTQRRQKVPMQAVDNGTDEYLFQDDGCEVSPSCLKCPLPECKYDNPYWFKKERYTKRHRLVLGAINREGLSVKEASRRFGLSRKTISRIMRRS